MCVEINLNFQALNFRVMITKAKSGKIDSREDFPSSRKKGKLKFFSALNKLFFIQTRKCNLCFAYVVSFEVYFSFSTQASFTRNSNHN